MSRLLLIFFSLALCLQNPGRCLAATAAEEPLRAAWLASGAWLPQNYSEEQLSLHRESVQAFVSHFSLLNSLARPARPGLLLDKAENGAGLAAAARALAERTDLDLILVTGPEALAAVSGARAELGRAAPPVLALTADCPLPQLRALAAEPGAGQPVGWAWPAGDGTDGVLLPAPAFWGQRLADYAGAVRFRRLGLIRPADEAPLAERAVALALRQQAEGLAERELFEVFTYDGLADTSPEQCREAVDYLFFDEIDALVLDGYGCFSPARADYAELLGLLRQRGIFPLAMRDSALAAGGALLAPAPGEGERLGQAFAAQFFAATAAHPGAGTAGIPRRLGGYFAPALPFFSVNLATAGSMGFDPPAALMAVSRDVSAP